MSLENFRLSVTEKIGYALGDLAANLIFQTLVTFIAFFYTDVYGIPAGWAAFIIFWAGILGGAVFTPIMGAIADRTRTRWGKFRPWILWTAIPFGAIVMLTFATPDFAPTGKLIYAGVTYLLLVMIYSANNLPYSALSGVLTGSMSERNSLSSYRFVAVMIAQFIIQVLVLPIVLILGDGDKAIGFERTMTILAAAGVVMLLITFLTTKERVVPRPEQESSVKDDLRDLARNRPWVIMLVLTTLVFVALALKGGSYVYYFSEYMNEPALAAFLENVGFNGFIDGLNNTLTGMGLTEFRWPEDPATSAFSLYNATSIICQIIGIFFSKALADRFGKRNVFGIFLFISTLFLLVYLVFPPDAVELVFLAQVGHGLAYGVTVPLLWAMIADVADYSEWKNNRRATGIIFSAMIFGLKVGLAIGGALVAMLLSFYGYEAGLPSQSSDTVLGIRLLISLYASIPFLIGCGLLFFYEINKEMETNIEQDLLVSRAKNLG
ncbi:sugar (glycoside-pentoside-hexuronide) transporter [Neolewinella xylanilytica]|uniref:Sugar (Glycoside-pentoside-hexuronide) transporter n=1 Tax=Neolewinella xylanilytica TaxID=1514080 RepID=A0A2S6I476_9BACT|nr:MFS transporter [Neolewinella xylanilytica]PPK85869.1 sugar (glycoside-pentoside-hexuronide) transporter [Neolewinella xylanilytica]